VKRTVDVLNGFGYATSLFEAALNVPGKPVHYESGKVPHILLCHAWTESGTDSYEILRAFIKQHPNCFTAQDRPTGGMNVRPNGAEGQYLCSPSGEVLALACECRGRIDEVRDRFLRDQGLHERGQPGTSQCPGVR
jgi:hypothetical protein